MNIFITGLTSGKLGGMEFHNLGNYAIIEPLIIYLKRAFPGSDISMSIQSVESIMRAASAGKS